MIAEELGYFQQQEAVRSLARAEAVGRALSGLINSMRE